MSGMQHTQGTLESKWTHSYTGGPVNKLLPQSSVLQLDDKRG